MAAVDNSIGQSKHAPAPRQSSIRLSFEDGAREVIVQTEDEDRFLMTCEEAARACGRHISLVEWKREFTKLLQALRLFIEGEQDLVNACFVAPKEGVLVVLFVPALGQFDVKLASKLADLDISVAQEFPNCQCEILQVSRPDEEGSLAGFIDTSEALLVYVRGGDNAKS